MRKLDEADARQLWEEHQARDRAERQARGEGTSTSVFYLYSFVNSLRMSSHVFILASSRDRKHFRAEPLSVCWKIGARSYSVAP